MTHDRRHEGHPASLRPRIGAQIQLLRIKNVQGTVLSQPSTQNRGPTQVTCEESALCFLTCGSRAREAFSSIRTFASEPYRAGMASGLPLK
jgi:hypothetical protein